MSSNSDVMDLERRAMAGGVSLLDCCGAARRRQPNADTECLALLHKQSPVTNDNHFATGFHSDVNRHRLNHQIVNTR